MINWKKQALYGLSVCLLLTPVVPFAQTIEHLLKTHVTHNGPNCWNSALFASGVLRHIRYTSPSEFRFFIESAACQPVPQGAQRSGDLQVFRRTFNGLSPIDREVHANIYLNQSSAFNKSTNYSTSQYAITPHIDVINMYGKTPEILNFIRSGTRSESFHCQQEECRNSIEVFRCGPIEDLKRSDSHYSEDIERQLDFLQTEIERQVTRPTRPTDAWNQNAEKILNELYAKINRECQQDATFYCRAVREALDSVIFQIQSPQPSWLNSH